MEMEPDLTSKYFLSPVGIWGILSLNEHGALENMTKRVDLRYLPIIVPANKFVRS